jgi:hypothetical protein
VSLCSLRLRADRASVSWRVASASRSRIDLRARPCASQKRQQRRCLAVNVFACCLRSCFELRNCAALSPEREPRTGLLQAGELCLALLPRSLLLFHRQSERAARTSAISALRAACASRAAATSAADCKRSQPYGTRAQDLAKLRLQRFHCLSAVGALAIAIQRLTNPSRATFAASLTH